MDLKLSDKNIIQITKEKRKINSKKKILSQNNNFNEFSDEEFEEKSYSESKQIEDKFLLINNSSEKSKNSDKIIDVIIDLFANKLKFSQNFDLIHNKYIQYFSQTQTQKDLSKTDYTYVYSFSYNKYIDPSKICEWEVPNMSRRSISSTKTLLSSTVSKSLFSMDSKSESNQSLETREMSSERESVQRNESRRTPIRTSSAQMFTRSQCLGGSYCAVPDCIKHKKNRKKSNKSDGILIPNSGQGLEPEFEFSEDDDYNTTNQLNQQKLSSYRLNNGYKFQTDEESSEDEEITVIKRVTNIFRTTINNTSRIIDSLTPDPIKRAANKCPSLWLTLFSLLLLLVPLIYVMSRHKSSLLSENSLDSLTVDILPNHQMNHLLNELKELKTDLRTLKHSNSEIKLKMKDMEDMKVNEFNTNDKFKHFNDRIESLEEYLNNISNNCCRNETDSMLALIDWRLSEFMASILKNNENSGQQLTPIEMAQQIKDFIRFEVSKVNDNLKENVEQKFISTIERFENQMKQKSNHMSSDITIDEIKTLITEALAIYDADKTGQPDFALEPSGGTIINTRCSETFDPYGVQYKIFGMPVWSSSISPRAVIQPSISPGECWAFKGSNGYLVIKLSQPITPSAFSYEHIPKQISRDGNIDSAPKEFQVRGLEDESDTSGHLLGNYIYEDNGRPMQYFEVQDPNPRVFQFIELVILSNHGHNDYTCLYRFRVHGKRIGH